MARYTAYGRQRIEMITGEEKCKDVKHVWQGEDGRTYGTIKERGEHYVRLIGERLWEQVRPHQAEVLKQMKKERI